MTLAINEFATQLVGFLQLADAGTEFNPYDSVYDDWGIDSLQAFQMIIIIESLAGALVPPEELPEIFTLQDAYDYYRTLSADHD